MIHDTRLFMLLSLVTFTVSIFPSTLLAFDEPMLSISTGNVTGVYYAAGSAVAKMHNKKRKEYNLRLLAEASEGSVANIQNVTDGTTAFGIAQANALDYAQNGEHYWQDAPVNNLRSVLGLYTEAFTVVAAVNANINSLQDLRGKIVNIGEHGSTDNIQAKSILGFVGLDMEKELTVSEVPTYEASELLQQGRIDAYLYTVGHPNLSIKEASHGARKIMIVPPSTKYVDALLEQKDTLVERVIRVDYYKDLANTEPVRTFGVKAILFCNVDTNEEVVYRIVKEVFENLDLFKRQHPAFAKLTPERLSTKLIVPLHPGAERYFKEAGLLR
ncbi:MAG: TAXI family TRAP transporter solute-binding subunit [Deltaproteobacteria bacterium]|nr:TAXI family TRAP transporter solute-binding subunit [Deltaproteobacteria bacterium]MBW2512929.1 TAXI family TRAP transporter solute-binding subunit [Deltaproteobacteria bacterium]